MMQWQKLGHVFVPENNHPWMLTHAANTVAEHLEGDLFRIYFNCRDEKQRAHIAYVDVELRPEVRVVGIAEEPVLAPGEIGLFDDSGVSLSCMITIDGVRHLYYLGWNLGVTVPWRNSIGLALLNHDTGRFERAGRAPLLDRSEVDPYSISYPFVLDDGGVYRMWYGSNLSWGAEQRDMAHLIKYAQSDDGRSWHRDGRIALPFRNDTEYAMSRPWVTKEGGRYRMWYSYRGDRYRIGYAESSDALQWERMDDLVGLDVSDSGWDSEMVCYPFLFDHAGERYMLYNGNRYGMTGFGIARLERDI